MGARCRCGGGDRRRRARGGGGRVLSHPPHLHVPGAVPELRPRSTLRAVVYRHGVVLCPSSWAPLSSFRIIHPTSSPHEAGGGWWVICRHCCWDWDPPSCSQPWRSRPTRHLPHEQLLVRLRMAMGSSSAGSTHDAPYEQLLVGLGAGAGSAFHVGGRRRVPATWHREGVGWCMPHGRPPPQVSQCPSLVSAGPR